MKQPFILTLVSSVACAATAANKAPENTTPTKSKTPNVVFIYADDLGYGDLECYGALLAAVAAQATEDTRVRMKGCFIGFGG